MYWLTTASLNGGWLLETPRSFHYWKPAPWGRPLPWLESLGNIAINPTRERGDKHPSHCINSGKRKRRKRECLKSCKTTLTVNVTVGGCQHISVQEHTESCCMYISPLTTTGTHSLFVHSVNWHSTAVKVTYLINHDLIQATYAIVSIDLYESDNKEA